MYRWFYVVMNNESHRDARISMTINFNGRLINTRYGKSNGMPVYSLTRYAKFKPVDVRDFLPRRYVRNDISAKFEGIAIRVTPDQLGRLLTTVVFLKTRVTRKRSPSVGRLSIDRAIFKTSPSKGKATTSGKVPDKR